MNLTIITCDVTPKCKQYAYRHVSCISRVRLFLGDYLS